ncbi:hypothetical protein ACJIZ3_014381 [Penstemon smallii]|uniref:F-box domain-containing protein n=1 Tax=Penstemon smallii TaxID=265156 RepID=A0ABD3RJP8_9LAMI
MAKIMEPSKHIPFDLINENILPRFPVKSLVRFTSVCKAWEKLIKSPEFIATHFKFNNRPESEGQYPLILKDKLCYTLKNQIPVYFDALGSISDCSRNRKVDFIPESCKGLILLKVLKEKHGLSKIQYLLWNPSIRKSITIESFFPEDNFHKPRPRRIESGYNVRGLGFHESSNDYRVVRIKYVYVKNKISPRVKIYSLKTNSWRNADSNPNGLMGFSGGVFLNGYVHWLATRLYCVVHGACYPNEYCIGSILSFDFEKECFGEMKLPTDFAEGSASPAVLVAFKEFQGSLVVVFSDFDVNKCFVWVMGEYGVTDSWYKKLSVRLPDNCGSRLGFTKNGMIVCEEYKQVEDWHTKKIRKEVSGYIFLDIEKFEEDKPCDRDNDISEDDDISEVEDCDDYNSKDDDMLGEEAHATRAMVIDYMESLALLK